MSGRQHAHRPEPDRITPREALGFLLLMAIVVLTLVLGLSTGTVPA